MQELGPEREEVKIGSETFALFDSPDLYLKKTAMKMVLIEM